MKTATATCLMLLAFTGVSRATDLDDKAALCAKHANPIVLQGRATVAQFTGVWKPCEQIIIAKHTADAAAKTQVAPSNPADQADAATIAAFAKTLPTPGASTP